MRALLRGTALFRADLVTDDDGQLTVPIELPNDAATYRVYALAAAADDRAGKGEAQFSIEKALVAEPVMPRAVRAGDLFEAGVVLERRTGDDEVSVGVAASGLLVEGPAEKRVHVVAGQRTEVRFTLRATAAGEAAVRFTARGAVDTNTVKVRLPVRPPGPREARGRGLRVERRIETQDGVRSVKRLAADAPAQLRVRVSAPAERTSVTVEIPVPAGLEILEPWRAGPERGMRGWFWTPFERVEYRDDRVVLHAGHLPRGLHEFRVALRATRPGRFVLPPACAAEAHDGGASGCSTGGSFVVEPLRGGARQ